MRNCPFQRKQFERTNSFRHPWEGYIEIDENFPVIATNCGTRVHPANLSSWWTADRAKFGLEGFTLHELRHTYLTLLAMNGVHPKVMQELAGHYSSQITMDIYTHVNMSAKRAAVAAVSKGYFSRAGQNVPPFDGSYARMQLRPGSQDTRS